MRKATTLAVFIVGAAIAAAMSAEETPQEESVTIETAKLSEGLIYAVNRTPERTFDTSRDVEVITQEQILRSNAQNLGQLLERQLGIGVINGESGTMPLMRGLGGKQVMFLIDGVKVNNATWRGGTKEYLNIFALSQIERIEIVRGVVSVLGSESLGGVVNIITNKGALTQGDTFGGSVSTRYASGEDAVTTSVAASAAFGEVRLHAGLSFGETRDVDGGGDIARQADTGFKQSGGHLNGQWFLTQDKSLSFGYQHVRADDQATPGTGTLVSGRFDPSQLQVLNVSYLDLTRRVWQDSLKITGYWNKQRDMRDVVAITGGQPRDIHEWDTDNLGGLNLELGTFLRQHHLVYGLDITSESVTSGKQRTTISTGVISPDRGNVMDGASYRTAGIYLQDKASLSRWLTVIAGARLARFEASGKENSLLGAYDIETKRANVTAALNVIGHVTPKLNLIANVIRGYRAPNLDELSGSSTKPGIFTIPNPSALPEKVVSMEGGVKYDGEVVRGSIFYFRNRFTDHLVPTQTTFRGLPFRDTNGNGRRDPGEQSVVQLANTGDATIQGFEGGLTVQLARGIEVFGSYSRLVGTDQVRNAPLSLMPPASGALGMRWSSMRHTRPWAEVDGRFAQAQHRLSATDIASVYVGPNGTPSYRVVDLRGGFTVLDRLMLSVAVENVLDEKYRFIGSNRYQPGRQLVVGSRYQF